MRHLTDGNFQKVDRSNYYLKKIVKENYSEDIYDLWEKGEAYGDSVTPSTYNLAYRKFMTQLISNQMHCLTEQRKILSLGSGNAFVEKELHQKGFQVVATDINEKAVELAKEKGLTAYQRNVFDLSKEIDGENALVYADGLFGHLFNEESAFNKGLEAIERVLHSDGILVISIDELKNGKQFMLHPIIPEFYMFSKEYFILQIESYGFKITQSFSYTYDRPLSHKRDRMIICAKKNQEEL